MAEIVYDSVTCPNPEVVMVEALNAMAVATKQAICKSLADSIVYTDTEVASINSRLDAIDSQDTLSKIAALKSLVDSLDLNIDGSVVNDLLAIKALAESAQASATSALASANDAKADALEAKTDVLAVSQSLASFQTSINATIASHESRISSLENALANLPASSGTDIATVTAIATTVAQDEVCKSATRLAAGLTAGVAAFIATLEGPCPTGDGGMVI